MSWVVEKITNSLGSESLNAQVGYDNTLLEKVNQSLSLNISLGKLSGKTNHSLELFALIVLLSLIVTLILVLHRHRTQ